MNYDNNNYAPIPRDILHKPNLKPGRATELQAYIDLWLNAAYKDNEFHSKGKRIIVERGEIITSYRELAERWQWGKDKVISFLKQLELDGDIKRESNRDGTRIKMLEYVSFLESISKNISMQTSKPPKEQTQKQTRQTHSLQGIAENQQTPNPTQSPQGSRHENRHESRHESRHLDTSNIKESEENTRHESRQKSPQKPDTYNTVYTINNSVCVIEPPQEYLKFFTKEQYNDLVNRYGKDITDNKIEQIIDKSKREPITSPLGLFKVLSYKPHKPNQTPSQRKPGKVNHNFKQRDNIDYDELERKLINR